jgi:hypothetical protein
MKIFLPVGDRWRLKHVAVKTVFVFIIKGFVDCFIVGTECRKTQLYVLCYSYKTAVFTRRYQRPVLCLSLVVTYAL